MIAPHFFCANVRKRITIFCALQEKLRFGNKGAPINQVEFDAEKLELPSNYVEFFYCMIYSKTSKIRA